MRSALLALLVATLLPSAAAAQGQTCVLLPPPDESTAPADVTARVDATITEELRAHELVVMASRDAQLRMADQPMERCSAIDCAPDVNRFLGTAFAVLTELTWLRGRPTMINVVLIGLDSGVSAGGQAVIERGDDLAAAVRTAFQTAWDRWQADNQGTLSIDTVPAGGFVEIDGHSAGRAPLRQLVSAGVHTIRTTLESYVTDQREVTIDRHEERALSITLASTTVETPVDDTPSGPVYEDRVQPHWGNWVIGGLGIAGAIALAVSPIMTALSAGTVTTRPDGQTDTVVFAEQSIAWTVASGVVLLGSVIWLIAHPIEEHVRITIGATSLGLEATW